MLQIFVLIFLLIGVMDSKLRKDERKRDARVRKVWKILNIILVCITIILAIFFIIQLCLATNSETSYYGNDYYGVIEESYELPDIYYFFKWMPYVMIVIISVVLSLIDVLLIIQRIINKNYKYIPEPLGSILIMFLLSFTRREYFTFTGYMGYEDQIQGEFPIVLWTMITCLIMINVFFVLSFPKKENTEEIQYEKGSIKKAIIAVILLILIVIIIGFCILYFSGIIFHTYKLDTSSKYYVEYETSSSYGSKRYYEIDLDEKTIIRGYDYSILEAIQIIFINGFSPSSFESIDVSILSNSQVSQLENLLKNGVTEEIIDESNEDGTNELIFSSFDEAEVSEYEFYVSSMNEKNKKMTDDEKTKFIEIIDGIEYWYYNNLKIY